MPRNKFGGNKAKKGKNQVIERTFILKEPDQEYATVVKTLGDGRFELSCNDGITRLGHIRGKMRRRVWIHPTDVVLVSMRDFDDNKVDIIHKYTPQIILVFKINPKVSDHKNIPVIRRLKKTITHFCLFDLIFIINYFLLVLRSNTIQI